MKGLDKVAARVAKRYARRCWWADEDDLRQEAMVAALRAAQSWDPNVGVPLSAYAYRACLLHVRRFLWKMSSPVSETDNRLDTLRGVHHLPIDRASFVPSEEDAADELYSERAWEALVREQVEFILGEVLPEESIELARKSLFDDVSPKTIASDCGMTRAEVYKVLHKARASLRNNAMLYELWRKKP